MRHDKTFVEAMPQVKALPNGTLTPRATESPRRPEMPTIQEEQFEEPYYWQDTSCQKERAFERTLYRVMAPTGSGQGSNFYYCYEIRWADGSSRRLCGHR